MARHSVSASSRGSRDLTQREQQVLRFVVAGRSNKWTAIELGISRRTVESHRSRIYRKCGVRSAMQLMALLHESSSGGLAMAENAAGWPAGKAEVSALGSGLPVWLPGKNGPGADRE
ncbi:MAG: helix-turn-helix transcriptional regulator [Pigmentiphaga sp.]|nr:helix-turn-helix transcriptional regulator [Pigmentiphaga sp.]